MECPMTCQTVCSARLLLDTFEEKSFDGDFVLPDYLPEIAAILACELEPVIENRQISGNRLAIDGTVSMRLVYVDNSRCRLFRYETSQPFSAGFTADGLTEPATVELSTTVSYVNYRAIGPRRVDVRGAYRVHARVTDTVCSELPCDTNDASVHLRRHTVTESLPIESASKLFAVNEVLDPGSDMIVGNIICTHGAVSVTDCKVLPGRVILKGEIALYTLYETGGDEDHHRYEECEHTLLYSQMLDMKAMTDADTVVTDVQLLSCDIHAETEEGTGKSLLVANLRLCAQAEAWRDKDVTVVTDAYSSVCPTTATTTIKTGYRLLGKFTRRLPIKQQVELPEGITDIVHLWCTCSPAGHEEHGALCRLHIHLLAKDENGSITCYERTAECPIELPISGNVPRFSANVWDCSYHSKDNRSLELSVTLELTGRDVLCSTQPVVTALESDPAQAYPKPEATLKMVFANQGESVWEIAKSSHASASAIMRENQLAEDQLAADMLLLIPIS
ncbi:MAG: DUF3794 domain-containing protein [Clostridia bacterium]|nr:DUF3794 domain-containing protein [Clostridia bacterium]